MNAITFLGTGNAMCTRCYNTCFYLRSQSGAMLVDAGGGNGIFRQLYKAHIPYEEIRHIFVTHVHTDHIFGVVWLIRKISPLIHKGKHPGRLMIYCNSEVRHAISTMCQLLIPRKINRAIGAQYFGKAVVIPLRRGKIERIVYQHIVKKIRRDLIQFVARTVQHNGVNRAGP